MFAVVALSGIKQSWCTTGYIPLCSALEEDHPAHLLLSQDQDLHARPCKAAARLMQSAKIVRRAHTIPGQVSLGFVVQSQPCQMHILAGQISSRLAVLTACSHMHVPPLGCRLRKPKWTPPEWLFGPAWAVMYAAQGYAGYKVIAEVHRNQIV